MAALIEFGGKYYRLNKDCKECVKIYKNNATDTWGICKRCGHLYFKSEGCKNCTYRNKFF